jgi:hypothetical protein
MDTTGVEEGTAGGNKVWNFSGLVPAGSPTTLGYITTAGTPYEQLFPGATLAGVVIEGSDTSFTYFTTASNRLTALGYASSNAVTQYSDPEVQMATPLNFNDPFSDQFRGEMTGDGFVIRTSGSVSVLNDSYGTITLPGGSPVAAARVKFIRIAIDSAFAGGFPVFTTQTTTESYEWFTQASKFPVLQIAYHSRTTNGNTQRFKQVEYNTHQTTDVGDGDGGNASAFRLEQNYPNPFNPSTTIAFVVPTASHVTLKIYDILGRDVATLINGAMTAGGHQVTFDASNIAAGMYIYRLQAGEFSTSRKLLLAK